MTDPDAHYNTTKDSLQVFLERPHASGAKKTHDGDAMLLLLDLNTHWRRIILWAVGTAMVVFAISFLLRPQYTSRASFMPEQSRQASDAGGLLGVASQLGLGGSGNSASPQLYAELVRSTSITDSVLSTPLHGRNGTAMTFAELLQEGAKSNSAEWERARGRLLAQTSATVNPRTNVIELQVRMPDPAIAQLAAHRYLDALNLFNRATRQTSARARREFLSRRLVETQDSLQAAENSLEEFLASNRAYESSPALRFVYDRRQRRLQRVQENFISLRSEYDAARLNEVNDQPLLTAIDAPSLPTRPTAVHHIGYLALGLGVGLLAGLFVSLGRVTFMRLILSDPVQYERLRRIIGQLPLLRGLLRSAERSVAAMSQGGP